MALRNIFGGVGLIWSFYFAFAIGKE